MTVEELVLLVQSGQEELMTELWERVYRFIRQQARARLRPIIPYSRDMEEELINAGYFALVRAVRRYHNDGGASFLHFLTFYLKKVFNGVLGLNTVAGRMAPDRFAARLDAPISDDAESITLADTLIDPDAEEAYLRLLDKAWRQDLHGILEWAINQATDDKPEARRVWFSMLEYNASLSEAAQRLGVDYKVAQAALDATRGRIMRCLSRYKGRDVFTHEAEAWL